MVHRTDTRGWKRVRVVVVDPIDFGYSLLALLNYNSIISFTWNQGGSWSSPSQRNRAINYSTTGIPTRIDKLAKLEPSPNDRKTP